MVKSTWKCSSVVMHFSFHLSFDGVSHHNLIYRHVNALSNLRKGYCAIVRFNILSLIDHNQFCAHTRRSGSNKNSKRVQLTLCFEKENTSYCYLPSKNRYQAIYRIQSGYTGIQVKFIYLLFCPMHWRTARTKGRRINCSGQQKGRMPWHYCYCLTFYCMTGASNLKSYSTAITIDLIITWLEF